MDKTGSVGEICGDQPTLRYLMRTDMFITGICIGFFLGVLLMALMQMSGRDTRAEEAEMRRHQ